MQPDAKRDMTDLVLATTNHGTFRQPSLSAYSLNLFEVRAGVKRGYLSCITVQMG